MNRKMRANLANKQARQKRSRREASGPLCDICGGVKIPVVAIPVLIETKPVTLH